MNFLKRLFKTEVKTLASDITKLGSFEEVVKDENIRNTLTKHLIDKYGDVESKRILESNKFGLIELVPGVPMVSIHSMNGKCLGLFSITNDEVEESTPIDPESKEAKLLRNSE